jgi:hypothetical protein
LRGWLTEQLNASHQKVTELAPVIEEVASLQIREADAHRHATEAEEKFTALAKRARLDDVEFERVRKE